MTKWNVVYNTTIAGTVSQEKIDKLREEIIKYPTINHAIWDIELKSNSSDKELAKYLMLTHETIEEEALEMEIDEVSKID